MRNIMMDIDHIHPLWWIPDRKPQPSRGKTVPMALFPYQDGSASSPGLQDSTPHLPGTAEGGQGAKKPESHSWAKDCSQIPSAFRFLVQQIKPPMYSFSDPPCLKSRWNISCHVFFFCSQKQFSMCILEFWTGKTNPGLQPSFALLSKCPWRDLIPAWLPSPIPWMQFLKKLGSWIKPNHRNTSHDCSIPLMPKTSPKFNSISWSSSGRGDSALQSHFCC